MRDGGQLRINIKPRDSKCKRMMREQPITPNGKISAMLKTWQFLCISINRINGGPHNTHNRR